MESSERIVFRESRTALTTLSRSGLLSCGMSPFGSDFLLSLCGLLKIAVMYT